MRREPLFDGPVCILDTETNGLDREPSAVPVELGAVILNRWGQGVACFSSLIRPDVDDKRHQKTWAWTAKQGTGLTRDMVLEAPAAGLVVAQFGAWLDLYGEPMVTAFNVGFDRPMLQRIGFDLPDARWGACIMLEASRIMGAAGALPWQDWSNDYKWPKAEEAMSFFGVQGPHKHRALADARVEAAILIAIRRREKQAKEPT